MQVKRQEASSTEVNTVSASKKQYSDRKEDSKQACLLEKEVCSSQESNPTSCRSRGKHRDMK